MCQMAVKNKPKTNKQTKKITNCVPFLISAALQFGLAADLKGAGLNSTSTTTLV